ncbi:MAG: putative Zn finger protein, partial [Arenicella sp.]
MNLKTFEKSFSKTILDRGKGYYKNGYVISLEETDTNEWFAEVDGTEVYEVEVSLNSYQDIISSHCDCPYGSACKHEVAVYLEMRKQLGSAKSTRKKVSPKVSKKEEVLTILKNAKTEDLHTFIANYASKNKEFKFEIMNRFGQLDSDPDEIRRHYQKL